MRKAFITFSIIHFVFLAIFQAQAFAGGRALNSSRMDKILLEDTTERLENIASLRSDIRELKLQMRTFEIALEEAKKKPSSRRTWNNAKKISDAVTAFTILGGAIAAYHFENKTNVLKIASFIGGLSSASSVITGLVADMSSDQIEVLTSKISELKPILLATEINLKQEVKYLCMKEPSNQMCK